MKTDHGERGWDEANNWTGDCQQARVDSDDIENGGKERVAAPQGPGRNKASRQLLPVVDTALGKQKSTNR